MRVVSAGIGHPCRCALFGHRECWPVVYRSWERTHRRAALGRVVGGAWRLRAVFDREPGRHVDHPGGRHRRTGVGAARIARAGPGQRDPLRRVLDLGWRGWIDLSRLADFLNILPGAPRDADGFLRLPWHVDYAGKITINGIGADHRTGAKVLMQVSALAWPYNFNVLGVTSPTFGGLEFVHEYFATEGESEIDLSDFPDDPYSGVIAIPPGIMQVRVEGAMRLEIGAGVPGSGSFSVQAEQIRP